MITNSILRAAAVVAVIFVGSCSAPERRFANRFRGRRRQSSDRRRAELPVDQGGIFGRSFAGRREPFHDVRSGLSVARQWRDHGVGTDGSRLHGSHHLFRRAAYSTRLCRVRAFWSAPMTRWAPTKKVEIGFVELHRTHQFLRRLVAGRCGHRNQSSADRISVVPCSTTSLPWWPIRAIWLRRVRWAMRTPNAARPY